MLEKKKYVILKAGVDIKLIKKYINISTKEIERISKNIKSD